MSTIKKYCLVFLLLFSPFSLAIGIGTITMHSVLGEQLLAEVALINAAHLSEQDILIQVASPDEHQARQIPYHHFSHHLKFTLLRNTNEQTIVLITSKQTLNEPYLHFLLQLSTPDKRLLKEITLLTALPTP